MNYTAQNVEWKSGSGCRSVCCIVTENVDAEFSSYAFAPKASNVDAIVYSERSAKELNILARIYTLYKTLI